MSTMRFEPKPDEPYGKCKDCGEVQQIEADSRRHMHDTFEAAKKAGRSSGHAIKITNPSRKHRIEMRTGSIVGEHIDEAMRDLGRLVDDGDVTADEVRDSLWMFSDFREAWDEWFDEEDDES